MSTVPISMSASLLQAEADQFKQEFAAVRDAVGKVIVGQARVVEATLTAIFCGGNVLLEGVPGLGKTELVKALSRVLELDFRRIQFTPDLMPADIVGTNIMTSDESGHYRFEFRKGPIFTQLLLADEINRASPKTQSGLLECMQERRVTVDVHSHELARPFVVLATQNPVEYEGTYPLPEAQLDRFMVRVSLGYPNADDEAEMLGDHSVRDRVLDLEPVSEVAEVVAAQDACHRVHASDALRRYVVSVLDATRNDQRTELGGSPRAGLMLLKAAKANAALDGRDHALPDDVQALAEAVLAHRLLLAPEAVGSAPAAIVRDALNRVPAL